MTIAILKDQGEINIPDDVRKRLDANPGDSFNVIVDGKNIVLVPAKVTENSSPDKTKLKLMHFLGSGKGLYPTVHDADAFIASERDQWD